MLDKSPFHQTSPLQAMLKETNNELNSSYNADTRFFKIKPVEAPVLQRRHESETARNTGFIPTQVPWKNKGHELIIRKGEFTLQQDIAPYSVKNSSYDKTPDPRSDSFFNSAQKRSISQMDCFVQPDLQMEKKILIPNANIAFSKADIQNKILISEVIPQNFSLSTYQQGVFGKNSSQNGSFSKKRQKIEVCLSPKLPLCFHNVSGTRSKQQQGRRV